MSNRKNKDDKDVDCSCYALSRFKKSCPPVHTVTHPLVSPVLSLGTHLARQLADPATHSTPAPRYYEFTPEEMKALEECDKESFYQRCLPFSTLFATLTYAAIKYGFLNPSPHFGVVPKVALAAVLGHWYGRLSYIPACEMRLRQLSPQSHLGNVMRQYHAERNPKDCKKK